MTWIKFAINQSLNVLYTRNHSLLLRYNVRMAGMCFVSGCDVAFSQELMDRRKSELNGRQDIQLQVVSHRWKRYTPESVRTSTVAECKHEF